ncbi:MAG: TetR family transcriptional regulator [Rhodoferax sp.]|nr:TetR family transcriptional regulator [Rhodoferax sp.]
MSLNVLSDRLQFKRAPDARVDRKLAILLAAEKLFAMAGYHATSIRQIADEAEVPLALVGYYFGQKRELFQAIFSQWNSTIEERLQALRGVSQEPQDSETLRRIIEAFVVPVVRLRASAEGEYYALLVARELSNRTEEADQVLRDYFDPMATAFIDAIHQALPNTSRAMAAWGYQFALGALIHYLSDVRVERLSNGMNRAADPLAAGWLVNFIVGGLRAAFVAPGTGAPAANQTANPLHPH